MDQEEYQDYFVDKAKELLNAELSDKEERKKPEMKRKRNKRDEKVEKEAGSKIPFMWDPRETKHLVNNRKNMDNKDLKKFFENETEFQEKLEDLDDWKGFSRWEERFLIQNQSVKTPEEMAEQLDRDLEHVKMKMYMLGIKVDV